MAKFKRGDKVTQVVPAISGEVVGYNIDQESGDVQYHVVWTDADQHEHSRFFKEDDIELSTPAAEDETA